MTAMAAMPAQLKRGFLVSLLAPGEPEMSEIETWPGRTSESTRRVTKSPTPSTAQPRKSKPGPRLATVAGANDLTEEKTGSGSSTMREVAELEDGRALVEHLMKDKDAEGGSGSKEGESCEEEELVLD